MVHEVALGLKAHHPAGVQGHGDLHQVGVAEDLPLGRGKVDGDHAPLVDEVALPHIGVAPGRQEVPGQGGGLLPGESGRPGGAGADGLQHQPALPGHLHVQFAAVHRGGEAVGGQGALSGGDQGEEGRLQIKKFGGGEPGVLLGDLRQSLQHPGGAAGDVVGEGTVVDECGQLGKILLHGLVDRACQLLTAPLLAGEPGLGGVHVLQGGRAGEQVGLEGGHLTRQGGRRVGQAAQALPLLLGAGTVHRR